MMFGGSLSSRRIGSREDVSGEFLDMDLDQRLPTSTRGSVAMAASRLAELGVTPGRYAGVEQLFAGAACMADALEPSSCDIRHDGSLVVAGSNGETTTFTWVLDRWRWSPQGGVNVEATPRRIGAITVIDFFACERAKQTPAARFYLAAASR